VQSVNVGVEIIVENGTVAEGNATLPTCIGVPISELVGLFYGVLKYYVAGPILI